MARYEYRTIWVNQDGTLAVKFGGGTEALPDYLTKQGYQGYQVVSVLYPQDGQPVIILMKSSDDP
jgi:hypothetical protein